MTNIMWKSSKKQTVHSLRFSWKTACGSEIYEDTATEETDNAVTCPRCISSLASADSARITYADILRYGVMITHIGHRAVWNGGQYTSQALDMVTAGHVLDMFHMGGVDSCEGDPSRYFLICIVGPHNRSRDFVLTQADNYESAYYIAYSMVEAKIQVKDFAAHVLSIVEDETE